MGWPRENLILPDDLRGVIRRKNCVAFIGSGISSSICKPWHQLINCLCERCGSKLRVNKNSETEDLLSAAQDAKDSNKEQYYCLMVEEFGRFFSNAPRLYDALMSLPFKCYLTTNFDPFLAQKAGIPGFECGNLKVYPDLDPRYMAKRNILYLHGIINEETTPSDCSIILSREEFNEAYGPDMPLPGLLGAMFTNDPIVFIGCQLREPALKKIIYICKQHQLKRIQLMKARKEPQTKPPPRFIFLAKPEEFDSNNEFDKTKSEQEMKHQESSYLDMNIQPIWYVAGSDHSALFNSLKQFAGYKDKGPEYGWSEGGLYGQ